MIRTNLTPGADIHGSCPSLTSPWGQRYFQTLRAFYAETGFRLLEHDGSYPGTPDAVARPPLQSGLENSVWAQWRVIDEFYRLMLQLNLALGVQACYRGPRLFDTDESRTMVAETVAWFKEHRRLLEADLIHGRRADGQEVDWMLHVDPFSPEGAAKAMLIAFNPLDEPVERTLSVPLELTGIQGRVRTEGPGTNGILELRGTRVSIPWTIPARSMSWKKLHQAD